MIRVEKIIEEEKNKGNTVSAENEETLRNGGVTKPKKKSWEPVIWIVGVAVILYAVYRFIKNGKNGNIPD